MGSVGSYTVEFESAWVSTLLILFADSASRRVVLSRSSSTVDNNRAELLSFAVVTFLDFFR